MKTDRRRFFILLVDDSRAQCESITHLLEAAGYDVHFVHAGEEALAFCRKQRPDMILLDLQMPGMSGLEILRQLRAQPARYWQPILLLGAPSDSHVLLQAAAQDADDFIAKPFIPALLLAKVAAKARILRAFPRITADALRLADYFEANEAEHELAAELFERLSDSGLQQGQRVRQYHDRPQHFYSDVVRLSHSPAGDEYLLLADFQREGLAAAICAYSLISDFHRLVTSAQTPAALLAQLNQDYVARFGLERPARFLLCHGRRAQPHLSIWNGGMDLALLIDQQEQRWQTIPACEARLGGAKGSDFSRCVSRFHGIGPAQLLIFSLNAQDQPAVDDNTLAGLLQLARSGPLHSLPARLANAQPHAGRYTLTHYLRPGTATL